VALFRDPHFRCRWNFRAPLGLWGLVSWPTKTHFRANRFLLPFWVTSVWNVEKWLFSGANSSKPNRTTYRFLYCVGHSRGSSWTSEKSRKSNLEFYCKLRSNLGGIFFDFLDLQCPLSENSWKRIYCLLELSRPYKMPLDLRRCLLPVPSYVGLNIFRNLKIGHVWGQIARKLVRWGVDALAYMKHSRTLSNVKENLENRFVGSFCTWKSKKVTSRQHVKIVFLAKFVSKFIGVRETPTTAVNGFCK